MQDVDVLTNQLVDAMRDNAVFVAAMGGNGQVIVGYTHSYPTDNMLDDAIMVMQPPAAIVSFRSFRSQSRSGQLEHTFRLVLKPLGGIGPVLVALRKGVVASSGLPFYLHQINSKVHPADLTGVDFRTEYISDKLAVELVDCSLRITERGVDN